MKKVFIMFAIVAVTSMMTSCHKAPQPKITDNEWLLKTMEIDGVPYVLTADNPTIMFSDSNSVTGFGGCNRFFGNYELDGSALNIELKGSTKAMCANLYIEDALFGLLQNVSYYEIDNGQLVISSSNAKEFAIFAPVKSEQK